MTTPEDRLARIEARMAIEDGMHAYAAAADAKYAPDRTKRSPDEVRAAAAAQAAIFAPDAVWQGGGFGGDLTGRHAIAAFFETSPWNYTPHLYGAARIALADDLKTATAQWTLVELGLRDTDGRVALLTGQTTQAWQHLEEGWRIARMGFDRLHAVELASTPDQLKCLIPLAEDVQ